MIREEHYIEGARYQIRSCVDTRYWHTSGGWPDAIHFGVVNDYGVIVRSGSAPAGRDLDGEHG